MTRSCSRCSSPAAADDVFCAVCGAQIDAQTVTATASPGRPAPSAPSQPEVPPYPSATHASSLRESRLPRSEARLETRPLGVALTIVYTAWDGALVLALATLMLTAAGVIDLFARAETAFGASRLEEVGVDGWLLIGLTYTLGLVSLAGSLGLAALQQWSRIVTMILQGIAGAGGLYVLTLSLPLGLLTIAPSIAIIYYLNLPSVRALFR